jgi:hypothetical protein
MIVVVTICEEYRRVVVVGVWWECRIVIERKSGFGYVVPNMLLKSIADEGLIEGLLMKDVFER